MATVQSSYVLPRGPARLRPFFEAAAPTTHVVLRVGVALLFIQHGVQKLFGELGGMGEPGATAPLLSLMGLAGVLEFGGGLLLLIGLLTRPMALVLMVQMIVAYFMVHQPQGGFPVQNQGELALVYAVAFAFLFGNGAGPLSIDRLLSPRVGRDLAESVPPGSRAQEAALPPRRRDAAA